MKRSELLDKLAMELDRWPSTKLSAYQVPHKLPSCAKWTKSSGRFCVQILQNPNFQITKLCWIQRRAELINCPPDSESPSWAAFKAQDYSGQWNWFYERPKAMDFQWDVNNGEVKLASEGAIPNGHRWQDTLTEVNQVPELNPEKSSITDSQARELAIETGQCSDGTQCGTFAETAYCDDCPNQPHEADARMLDAQFAADIAAKRPNANSILNAAAHHMQERAATYDKPQGERSMGATVDAFHAVTGHALTEEQGWLFMQLLKAVRSQQGAYRSDSYEDGAAYVALAGEAAAKERS